jgi:hypothetical protein
VFFCPSKSAPAFPGVPSAFLFGDPAKQERPSPNPVGASDAMKERGLLPLQWRLPA